MKAEDAFMRKYMRDLAMLMAIEAEKNKRLRLKRLRGRRREWAEEQFVKRRTALIAKVFHGIRVYRIISIRREMYIRQTYEYYFSKRWVAFLHYRRRCARAATLLATRFRMMRDKEVVIKLRSVKSRPQRLFEQIGDLLFSAIRDNQSSRV